jgi:RNA polymerase sigma-32 factor
VPNDDWLASGEPLRLYLKEIAKFPTMSSEEERRALARAAEGDESAAEHLFEALLALTATIAMEIRPPEMTPLDAIVEANVALKNTIRSRPGGDLHTALRHAIEASLGSEPDK